eukprot:427946-Prymnesium_polylepis.2
MGERGNLTAGEILEQVCHARRWATPRNIVFMGMGEPLNNYEAVRVALTTLTDEHLFYIAPSRITVSTVGVLPRMRDLARDVPGVALALSLHAPNQALRASLLPSARQFPLDQLMAAVDDVTACGGGTVQMEYVVLDGVNDSEHHAHQLGALLAGRRVYANLIPYNHNPSLRVPFAAPTEARVRRMQAVLQSEYDVTTTVRTERGADIAGACGQLSVARLRADGRAGRAHAESEAGLPLAPDYSQPIWKDERYRDL